MRHPLPLSAPMSVKYELIYGRPRGNEGSSGNFAVGICDDGSGSQVIAFDLFDMEANDLGTQMTNTAYEEGPRSIESAKTYELLLAHDGKKATLSVGGKKKREIETGARTSGQTFLWIHSQITLAVPRIVIEGTLSDEQREAAREAWVAGKLADMGLGD